LGLGGMEEHELNLWFLFKIYLG
jgi:hypothetical protein